MFDSILNRLYQIFLTESWIRSIIYVWIGSQIRSIIYACQDPESALSYMIDRILNKLSNICLTGFLIILIIYVWQDTEYALSYMFDRILNKLYHKSLTNREYAVSHAIDRILNKFHHICLTGYWISSFIYVWQNPE